MFRILLYGMKRVGKGFIAVTVIAVALVALFFSVRFAYPRPHYETVKASGLQSDLVYALIKSESSFRERAKSGKGAVGLMQIQPATAQFICAYENLPYDETRLTEGEYNVFIGCKYLAYLLNKFEEQTALAAYNAGEGTVTKWLSNSTYSSDGKTLKSIPYAETANYIKRIERYRKIYRILY